MSSLRPNSVCDTTPLQRFESQSSSSEPSSPALNGYCMDNETSALNRPDCSAGACACDCAGPVSGAGAGAGTGAGAGGGGLGAACDADGDGLINVKIITRNEDTISDPSTATTLANHNNNKIDVSLNSFAKPFGVRKMDNERGTRQILIRILCDLGILACVLFPIFGMQYWGVPHNRGFFCADETIKLPYQESTLKNWHMIAMCVAVPISLITLVEFYRAHDNDMRHFEISTNEEYFFCHLPVPNWVITCYKKIGFLMIGAGVAKLTADIAKYSVGRLRPYFYTICQPIMADGTTCSDKINSERYIEDFYCQSSGTSAEILKSMRLSFPSGHTNIAFFTMVYIVIYLQKRMTWERSKMFKHLLQFLLLMFAWYTALTRVSDYKHHYTDVMAGAAIGTAYSIIVTLAMW